MNNCGQTKLHVLVSNVVNILRQLGCESTYFIYVLSKELPNGLGITPVTIVDRVLPELLNFLFKNLLDFNKMILNILDALALSHSNMKAFTHMV